MQLYSNLKGEKKKKTLTSDNLLEYSQVNQPFVSHMLLQAQAFNTYIIHHKKLCCDYVFASSVLTGEIKQINMK